MVTLAFGNTSSIHVKLRRPISLILIRCHYLPGDVSVPRNKYWDSFLLFFFLFVVVVLETRSNSAISLVFSCWLM